MVQDGFHDVGFERRVPVDSKVRREKVSRHAVFPEELHEGQVGDILHGGQRRWKAPGLHWRRDGQGAIHPLSLLLENPLQQLCHVLFCIKYVLRDENRTLIVQGKGNGIAGP